MVFSIISSLIGSKETRGDSISFNLPSGLTVEEYKELMEYTHELNNKNELQKKLKNIAMMFGTTLTIVAGWYWLEKKEKVPPLIHTLVNLQQSASAFFTNIPKALSDKFNSVTNVTNTGGFTCNGHSFPSFNEWLDNLPGFQHFAYTLLPASALREYNKDKKEFREVYCNE